MNEAQVLLGKVVQVEHVKSERSSVGLNRMDILARH